MSCSNLCRLKTPCSAAVPAVCAHPGAHTNTTRARQTCLTAFTITPRFCSPSQRIPKQRQYASSRQKINLLHKTQLLLHRKKRSFNGVARRFPQMFLGKAEFLRRDFIFLV